MTAAHLGVAMPASCSRRIAMICSSENLPLRITSVSSSDRRTLAQIGYPSRGKVKGFETHLAETKNQVRRLEEVFRLHGVPVEGVDCPAIDGILTEASDVAGEVADKRVLDAALTAAAQAVEHYEITRYGTLIAWAEQLGRKDCASLLQQNLDEEKATDTKLNALALRNVNQKAA
jgi:ferritin-like metal-binding protein YciE